MKKALPLAGALALLLVATPLARAEEPYVIDTMLPLTGAAAFLGKGEQVSLTLGQGVVNETGGIKGRPLQLVFHDDQSNPQIAVQLASGFIAKKPAVVLGSSLVASCRAMAPLMEHGPVDFCFSPGIHPEKGYVFSGNISTLDLIDALVLYIRMKGWTRVALMFSSDATGQDAENGVKGALALPENKSMQVVDTEHFNITDVSVSAQIENVKAAKPQILIAWSTGTPIATIFKGIVQAGLDVPVATTAGNMTYAQMHQYADFLPKTLLLDSTEWVVTDRKQLASGVAAAQKRYFDAFAKAGVKPDVSSDLAWDPLMNVVAALRHVGPGATAEEVRAFLASQTALPGVDGVYNFVKVPQRGLGESNSVVTVWDAKADKWLPVSKPGGAPL
ncbi:MAG TPA: ABC transporter substrate-binding protein [Stellaceae bacterium]|nr:ABC transporter substrate-binding protein [Stellaceae bacterium]